jgi:FMN phosphatase YigB (HAD superfamily)
VADLGLVDLFDGILTSAVTGYEKPHREMYAVPHRPMWMVGEDLVADIAGADAAGIPAILVRQGADLHDAATRILG